MHKTVEEDNAIFGFVGIFCSGGVVLRPALARIPGAPRAMESTDAILFFAREQMSVMTPDNQARFEKCIELVELGALPAECLATVAEGIVRKQRGNPNKAPQTLQPDVTLRSGGRSSAFLGNSASPSNASSGPPLWSDVVKKGTWVPLKSDMYYDDATAQWKVFMPYRWQSGKGEGKPAEWQSGKGQGKPGVGKCRGKSKGKKGGKGFFQKVKICHVAKMKHSQTSLCFWKNILLLFLNQRPYRLPCWSCTRQPVRCIKIY